jgi:cation diffusion facilitator CzcD-associated flavoprotein CzcO
MPDYDVIVMGAGLSGIDAGYRLQTLCPDRSYTILEARDSMGGTWDLFRYPGIRSDSDLFTFGYPFKPWRDRKSLADGPSILRYIKDTAAEFGIDEHIQYNAKVVHADFDTEAAEWTLTMADGRALTCRFWYSCAGYYDYDHGYLPDLPGLDDFAGPTVHPQFWPQDLDYSGKRIVVIGSGATAVTLVPELARSAGHVTMLQRSPTWISPMPPTDALADAIRRYLPAQAAHRIARAKNIALSTAFYQFSRRHPQRAAAFLRELATKALGDRRLVDEHFSPDYNVWDQRVCVAPNADLFTAIRQGRAEVVTDHIERIEADGVRLQSGRLLRADILITATGLQLQPNGGVPVTVDGRAVALPDQYVFLGAMITSVPNYAMAVGYTNASWTLRADLTSRLVCKTLNWMRDQGYDWVVPQPSEPIEPHPLMDLQSGYIQRAADQLPRQGEHAPWRMRQNYLLDAATTLRTDLSKHLTGHRSRQFFTIRRVGW